MAKMIPSRVSADTKSNAEKKLFYKLQDMEGTEDWTVLHSVGIADHPTQSQGETDFVVIIPKGGIFVLEVKGGGISFHNGEWKSTDQEGTVHDIKDPVHEANNAMHALMQYMKEKASPIEPASHSLFGYGVVFPDSELHGKFSIPDIGDAQIADYSNIFDMKQYLTGLAKYCKERKPSFVEIPDASACKRIVQLLRPNFDSHISMAQQINTVEKQIITLTEKQQDVFEGLKDNERCLVRGSAGTGKTLLATNLTRDLAREGKRVAFFCYNRQLAEYLKQNTADDGITCCGSLTDYMLETLQTYSEESVAPDVSVNKDKYYKEILPSLFIDCFIENELQQFDFLVIDEAQDLMTEQYLDVLDILLSGGINDGNWCLFMDAERQNVFHMGMSYEDIKAILKGRRVFYAKFELRENCRNAISIIKELDNLFGSTTRYFEAEAKGSVVRKTYRKDKDQAKLITSTVNKLLTEEELKPEQITILSPYRYENSVVALISSEIPVSNKHDPGKIFFSTIDAFKGLENSVIIITDISDIRWEKDISRMYVGMTRAMSALYIFLSESANRNLGKLKVKGENNE